MSKYIAPGDSDAMRIWQAEQQLEQQLLAETEQKLKSGNLAANDAAKLQMEVVRRRDNIRSLQNMIQEGARKGIQPGTATAVTPTSGSTTSTSSTSQAPSGSFRVSASGPAAASVAGIPGGGGIGDYIAGVLREQMGVQQQAIQTQQGATTRASQAAAAATVSGADRNEQILNERLRVQGQFGLGPTAKEDLVAKTLQELQDLDARYAQERSAYDEMASTSFFDDPLGWIGAQLNRGQQAAKVNALADREDVLTGVLRRNMTLSEDLERTVQINTNEIDKRTADFQARQQIAEGEAKVAALQAEGARANMSAAAVYGAEIRKDQKTEAQRTEDELQRRKLELIVAELDAKKRQSESLDAFTGSVGGERALDNKSPEIRNAIQGFVNGAATNPVIITEHGVGVRSSDPAMYDTASKLTAAVRERAARFKADRKNPAKQGSVTWKMADDEDQAWLEIRDEIAATNGLPSRQTKASTTLTGSEQDRRYNPLRADHLSFAEAVQKAAAVGAQPPVSPGNLLVQMYSKLNTTEQGKLARNPLNGQLYTEHERAILGAIRNMAVDGNYKLQDGKPVTPEVFGELVAQYYKAASSWTVNLNKAERMGLPKPTRYTVSLPKLEIDGSKTFIALDVMNPREVANYLQQEIKMNAGRKAEQEANKDAFRRFREMSPVWDAILPAPGQ